MPLGVCGGRGGNKQIHELGFHISCWLQIRCFALIKSISGHKWKKNVLRIRYGLNFSYLSQY